MRPLYLVVCGPPPRSVSARHGSAPQWFAQALRAPDLRLETWDATSGAPAPAARDAAGVLVAGSQSSLVDPEPWMDRAAAFARDAADAGAPVLGVCFGHQLLARAWGGRVRQSPRGRERGHAEVELSEAGVADPLFDGLGPRLGVFESHGDEVEPGSVPDAIPLASNAHSPVQAMALGDAVRSVQFHPEFTAALSRAHIEAELGTAGPVAEAPDGPLVLANWLRHWVRRA